MYCPNCGTKQDQTNFCYKCGASLPTALPGKIPAVDEQEQSSEFPQNQMKKEMMTDAAVTQSINHPKSNKKLLIMSLSLLLVLLIGGGGIFAYMQFAKLPLEPLWKAAKKTMDAGSFKMELSATGAGYEPWPMLFSYSPGKYLVMTDLRNANLSSIIGYVDTDYTACLTPSLTSQNGWDFPTAEEHRQGRGINSSYLSVAPAFLDMFEYTYWGAASGNRELLISKAKLADAGEAFVQPENMMYFIEELGDALSDKEYLEKETKFRCTTNGGNSKWTFTIDSSSAFWSDFKSALGNLRIDTSYLVDGSSGIDNLDYADISAEIKDGYLTGFSYEGIRFDGYSDSYSFSLSEFGQHTVTIPEDMNSQLVDLLAKYEVTK